MATSTMRITVQQKIVLLGDTGCGKTSIATRFCRNTFDEDSIPTVGASYQSKAVELDTSTVKLEVRKFNWLKL